jgi:hypothetical protein
MKLLSFEIPELANLSPDAREAILKKCVQSPRVRNYRLRAPKVAGTTLVVLFFVMFFLGWSTLASVAGIVVGCGLLLLLKVAIELRLVRIEARAAAATAP